jgi:ABC-type branched-subunit amino acid transport system substrate-binding protein
VQQAKPDVVATAVGGDDIKALRQQVSDLKLEDKAAWINNQQDWPDIWGAPETLFGVFGTNWYHYLPLPGVDEFVKRWQATYPQSPIRCRAMSPTAATWRRASCCGRSSEPADQQPEGHQAARRSQDVGGRPHAALRRLHRSSHSPGAADHLSRPPQYQAQG